MTKTIMILAIAAAFVAGTITTTGLVFAHGGDGSLIHACVSKSNGATRIVAPFVTCKSGENSVDWPQTAIPGPAGPVGPVGPAGIQGEQGEPGTPGTVGFMALVRPGNITFPQGTDKQMELNSANDIQTETFTASGNILVTYEAECAVSAAADVFTTWVNVDIQLVNVDTNVVTTLEPSVGGNDGFCTSNGSVGADGWARNSITGIATDLPEGNYAVRILANVQNGVAGTSGWLGDSTLVIWK